MESAQGAKTREDAVPGASSRSVDAAHCETARAEILRVVGCGETVRDRPALQGHFEVCPACKQSYREAVLTAARVGRRARLERDAGRPLRLAALERGFWTFDRSRARRWRMLLVPTFLFVLIVQLFPDVFGKPRVTVGVLSGTLRIGREVLAPGADDAVVRSGRQCVTDADGRAVFHLAAAELTLLESSVLLVENGARARFRLERGSLSVRGTCTLTTLFGVIEVGEGAAFVREENGGFCVGSESGAVRVVDSEGTRELAPGERLQLAHG